MFKGLSVAKTCLRPASASLTWLKGASYLKILFKKNDEATNDLFSENCNSFFFKNFLSYRQGVFSNNLTPWVT